MGPAPMQQVAVEAIGIEVGERAFARCDGAGERSVLRHDLGHQEDLVSTAGYGLGDNLLGGAQP